MGLQNGLKSIPNTFENLFLKNAEHTREMNPKYFVQNTFNQVSMSPTHRDFVV
jgi:hypothetical protein